jgi:GxxExxY protein
MIALSDLGMNAAPQVPLQVSFRERDVGRFVADVVVDGKVIVEIKAVNALAPEHQAQLINYLNATGIEVRILVNFGRPKLQYKRLYRSRTG